MVFDGDDYSLYEVDRGTDKWAVLPGPMMQSTHVSRLLHDCEIAVTHYEGRIVEVKGLPGSHEYASYNRKRGTIVGPPRNGKIYVSVEANENDRKKALHSAEQLRCEAEKEPVASKNASGKRRKYNKSGSNNGDDTPSVAHSDGKAKVLLPFLAKYVCEPSRIPGERFQNEYTARNNDTLELIGSMFGFASGHLLELNKEFYPGLRIDSKLQTGTKILLLVGVEDANT